MMNVLIFNVCLLLTLFSEESCFYIPRTFIVENDAGPFPKDVTSVFRALSMDDMYVNVSGPGMDEYPIGLFSFDTQTKMLKVHGPVDREEFPGFPLIAHVYYKETHQPDGEPVRIFIYVYDVNDNPPMFDGPLKFTVTEQDVGTMVGQVGATDRDSDYKEIRYTLLTGSDLFAIHPKTGVITTVTNTLDREVKDKYLVTIQITDNGGREGALSTTGTVTITVDDINDNPPTFIESSYEVSIRENEADKLLLRIPVEDEDLRNTSNWISVFVITKGNQNGNFRVETDSKTNEGLLYVSKALDFEKTKAVNLEITACNEAELNGTESQWASIPVKVTVIDVSPQFTSGTVTFPVKENTARSSLIGTYTAVDVETKSSDGIKYFKATDPASWVSVDETTGELRVANTVDRESQFVQSGLYSITVEAVDAASETGTGTVILVVEDVNDNKPTLPAGEQVLCERDGELGSVLLMAQDNDQSPFSFPFNFSLPDCHNGTWSLQTFNQTAATLKQIKPLDRGVYNVSVHIMDLQGFGGTQMVKVKICQCWNGVLLAVLLPLALLLLLATLLAVFCLKKREKMEDRGGILLRLNAEAPWDDTLLWPKT